MVACSMHNLEFGGKSKEPDIRWLYDMKDVIYDQEWLSKAQNFELYYMYRDLFLSRADKDRLIDQRLRYDITIIPPNMLGREYIKTAGHYHPAPPGGKATFPEIYEVLEGEALYILQKQDLSDVVAVNAYAGDKVLIPPDYGHISINPSPDSLLTMANIVSTAFQSEYGEYEKYHGAVYYEMGSGKMYKNSHYPVCPPMRHIGAGCGMGTHRICKAPLYNLIGNEDALAFLNFPEKFLTVFSVLLKG